MEAEGFRYACLRRRWNVAREIEMVMPDAGSLVVEICASSWRTRALTIAVPRPPPAALSLSSAALPTPLSETASRQSGPLMS